MTKKHLFHFTFILFNFQGRQLHNSYNFSPTNNNFSLKFTFPFLKRVLSLIYNLRKIFSISSLGMYLCCVEFFKVCSQALALSECCRRFFVSAGSGPLWLKQHQPRCRGAKSFHVLHGVRGQALQSPICAANKSRLPSGAAMAAKRSPTRQLL